MSLIRCSHCMPLLQSKRIRLVFLLHTFVLTLLSEKKWAIPLCYCVRFSSHFSMNSKCVMSRVIITERNCSHFPNSNQSIDPFRVIASVILEMRVRKLISLTYVGHNNNLSLLSTYKPHYSNVFRM